MPHGTKKETGLMKKPEKPRCSEEQSGHEVRGVSPEVGRESMLVGKDYDLPSGTL